MHHYRILKDKRTVLVILVGSLTMESSFEIFRRIISDQDFRSDFTILIDFRMATISLSLGDLKNAAEKYKEYESFKGAKVLLVDRSVDTAKIMIFRNHVGLDERFYVYSTLEGASSFLQMDLTPYLMEEQSIREDLYLEG